MQNYIQRGELQVAEQLDNFLTNEALPGSDVTQSQFWEGMQSILAELMPANEALLAKREELQQQIDDYCRQNNQPTIQEYKAFLEKIGYLVPKPETFTITTSNVDAEIATMAGPQLVVPINNARYALNAANARWGSLYDAVYGTDVLSEDDGAEKGQGYNPARGQKVIEYVRFWMDTIAPLQSGSHANSTTYQISDGELVVQLSDERYVALAEPQQFIGYKGSINAPTALLIKHHGLHIEIQLDPDHPVGNTDPAGIKDVLVEAAITTIMDCEDSVAAVDAEDKTLVYRNWLGLMQGNLSVEMHKGDKKITRKLAKDRTYTTINGEAISLPGRSLMFVRNVGHLMTNLLFQE